MVGLENLKHLQPAGRALVASTVECRMHRTNCTVSFLPPARGPVHGQDLSPGQDNDQPDRSLTLRHRHQLHGRWGRCLQTSDEQLTLMSPTPDNFELQVSVIL